jgi:organic radical activating enzyme
MNKTYCALPWVHTSLQNGNEILPCCRFMKSQSSLRNLKTFKEGYYGSAMDEVRQKMLRGDVVDGCQQCYRDESANQKSLRQESIEQFGIVDTIKLKRVEINFDNLCNLKCRMCASPHSHLWYDEEKQLYGRNFSEEFNEKKYDECTLYQDMDYSDIGEIEIHGGEPLYSPHIGPFFEKLKKERGLDNISLKITTNCTIKPREDIYDAFLNVHSLEINLSMDAVGTLNDFIRKNSNFFNVLETAKYFYKLFEDRQGKRTKINILSAVGLYNFNSFGELEQLVKTDFPKCNHSHVMIQYPTWLDVKNAPQEYKEKVKNFVTNKNLLNHLSLEGNNYFDHFLNFHNKMNEMRKEELGNANPWLSKFIEDYTKLHPKIDSTVFFAKYVDDLLN